MTPIKRQITCINKLDRDSSLERISHIGGVLPDGTDWTLPLDKAIQYIIDGKFTFFVSINDNVINVEIAEREGHKYLKTKPDKTKQDNLLSLPSCSLWK